MSDRQYLPPQIGDQTPNDIFAQGRYGKDFTNVLKRWGYSGGTITTRSIAVFVDGACSFNGYGHRARAGMGVYFGEGSRYNFHEELEVGRKTSQRAEINAAILALQEVKDLVKKGRLETQTVVLVSDSRYVVKAMTDWAYDWRDNGWRNRNGGKVKNKTDFMKLDDLIEDLEDNYGVYVKLWRVGRRYNEGADREANKALGR